MYTFCVCVQLQIDRIVVFSHVCSEKQRMKGLCYIVEGLPYIMPCFLLLKRSWRRGNKYLCLKNNSSGEKRSNKVKKKTKEEKRKKRKKKKKKKSNMRDTNLRPHAHDANALTNELRGSNDTSGAKYEFIPNHP